MNCEQYVTIILQKAKQTLDISNYNFLVSCSNFEVSDFYSNSFNHLQGTSISNDINNVLYYYYIKAMIKENIAEKYTVAIEYINKLQDANINTKIIEKQILNALINSVNFESRDSLINIYTLISTIDKENIETNLQRFFENIHNFIRSKWNEEFDVIQYATLVLTSGFDQRYTANVKNCLDQIFLNIFKKLFREGNLEGYLKFKKYYAQFGYKENQEIEEKYKSLVASRFMEIATRGQVSETFEEKCSVGHRIIFNNFIYYSVIISDEWYLRLIKEVTQLDIILNRVLQTEIVIAGVKKRLGKIDLLLDIKAGTNTLKNLFEVKRNLPFLEYCLIFSKISQFLAAFQNYQIQFCFDPSCILLLDSGPVILIPDESFCVLLKDSASLVTSSNKNLEKYSLTVLMKDSIKYLTCAQDELEDLERCIDLIKTRPQVTIEQITDYFLSKL